MSSEPGSGRMCENHHVLISLRHEGIRLTEGGSCALMPFLYVPLSNCTLLLCPIVQVSFVLVG